MTPEQKAAWINGQVAIFNCRVQGMIAENTVRQHRGESMAYPEDSFAVLEREFSHIGFNAVIEFFRD